MERKSQVNVWLAEKTDTRLEGVVSGFDEFMNIVLTDVQEINTKSGATSRRFKSLLLKGDCISLVSTNS